MAESQYIFARSIHEEYSNSCYAKELNPKPYPGLSFFLYGFKNLLNDFRVKDLRDMKRQNNSSLISYVDSMAAFGTDESKSGFNNRFSASPAVIAGPDM